MYDCKFIIIIFIGVFDLGAAAYDVGGVKFSHRKEKTFSEVFWLEKVCFCIIIILYLYDTGLQLPHFGYVYLPHSSILHHYGMAWRIWSSKEALFSLATFLLDWKALQKSSEASYCPCALCMR